MAARARGQTLPPAFAAWLAISRGPICERWRSFTRFTFAAAIGLRSRLEDFAPTIPDWANDQHTLAGRKLGRGLQHFREEGAKLVPEPTEPDLFVEEAYRLWAIKQHSKQWRGPVST
ncbi:hypothetical protein SAMN05443247_01085 [Bradyrhizobium erythrophlei]|nr:hypothetical protein SAMN05443247_01085 [Bradyrhizobium erythrophlei]